MRDTYLSGENLRFESESPLVFELFKILRASLTFLGTEAGGCGGAVEGKDVGPEIKKMYLFIDEMLNSFCKK